MQPCSGKPSRINPKRPSHICCGSSWTRRCMRFNPFAENGIAPDFQDQDGVATCADRVTHPNTVGEQAPACAPEA
jgi:hypothetical protein